MSRAAADGPPHRRDPRRRRRPAPPGSRRRFRRLDAATRLRTSPTTPQTSGRPPAPPLPSPSPARPPSKSSGLENRGGPAATLPEVPTPSPPVAPASWQPGNSSLSGSGTQLCRRATADTTTRQAGQSPVLRGRHKIQTPPRGTPRSAARGWRRSRPSPRTPTPSCRRRGTPQLKLRSGPKQLDRVEPVRLEAKRAAGEGGIKGVRPPPVVLKPPPSIAMPAVCGAGSTWDILASFAPDEKERAPASRSRSAF
ncbi:hypothetical protein PR202_ga07689 [Eleusine coracana subsp. coracana]|uniref:Uncharacterized protein n=1 Tax=Eleusine coracana subsp. coracana TaxID=191504 RepID=A0AAV5BYP3_ELECO|nr:hypothetical protein PR202_ga07689 [Eleusine coracana subsp. coracana]